MRSDQGRAAQHPVESHKHLILVGIFALLAILVLSAIAAPITTLSRSSGPAAHVAQSVPHMPSGATSAPAASAHPSFVSTGGLYLQGFNATPSALSFGESTSFSITVAGATVIPATLNVTYGSASALGSCDGAGFAPPAYQGDWCPSQNATSFTLTPANTGVYTVWVWANATCNPTPLTFAPCSGAGSLTLTVVADPVLTLAGPTHWVNKGPFAAPVSLTTTFSDAYQAAQGTEKVIVYSMTGSGREIQWQNPADAAITMTGPVPASYSYTLGISDLDLPAGVGNLPAGNYSIGVQFDDANGTILVSETSNSVSVLVTQASVSPSGSASFVAGSVVPISWSASTPTEDNNLTLTVSEPGGTVVTLGNVFQATGFSSGADPLTLTLVGTYTVKLAIGTNSPQYDPTAWGTTSVWGMFNVTASPTTTCPPGSHPSGSICLQVNNWANTTFTNGTSKVAGLGVNAIGAMLIVIGILIGGVIGLMTGMMGNRKRMPPTDMSGSMPPSNGSQPPAGKSGGEFS